MKLSSPNEEIILRECDLLQKVSEALALCGNHDLSNLLAHVEISIRGNLDELVGELDRHRLRARADRNEKES